MLRLNGETIVREDLPPWADQLDNVGFFAPLIYPIPVETDGGIERDLELMVRAVVALGKRAYVFASADSRIGELDGVELIPVTSTSFARTSRTYDELRPARHAAVEAVEDGLVDLWRRNIALDVMEVYDDGPRLAASLGRLATPKIVNLSNSPNLSIWGTVEKEAPYYGRKDNVQLTALTHAHQRALLGMGEDMPIEVLPYGVSSEFATSGLLPLSQAQETPISPLLARLQQEGQDYILLPGTQGEAKSTYTGIMIYKLAKKMGLTNVKLVLMGAPNPSPKTQKYAAEKVTPYIDGNDIFNFGPADEQQKWELCRFSLGSLFCSGMENSDYYEAYCRLLAECAQAGGLVVGIRSDTYNEIMFEGVTGLGFDTIEEAAKNILFLSTMNRETRIASRKACIATAKREMGADRYVSQSLDLMTYKAYGNNLHRRGPEYTGEHANDKLEYVPYDFSAERIAGLAPHTTYRERMRKNFSLHWGRGWETKTAQKYDYDLPRREDYWYTSPEGIVEDEATARRRIAEGAEYIDQVRGVRYRVEKYFHRGDREEPYLAVTSQYGSAHFVKLGDWLEIVYVGNKLVPRFIKIEANVIDKD